MTSFFAFIFVIGVLVFVHELGHFLAARRIGVKVLTFSLGFGPRLVSFRRGDTEYCVCAIPLGGYVKMAGENPDDDQTGSDDEFMSKSKWERFQVLIMGPVMNLVLAVVVMTFVLYQGAEVPAFDDAPPVVGSIEADSVAEQAGFAVGDLIVSIDNRRIETWEDLFRIVSLRPDRELSVRVRSDAGVERTISVVPDSLSMDPNSEGGFEMGYLGIGPMMEPQIRSVSPGDPADQAGILEGDVIAALEGKAVSQEELIETINASAGTSLQVTVRRGDEHKDLDVTPALVGDVGLIGVSISPYVVRIIEPGFVEAIGLSLEQNYEWTGLIVETLAGLFTADTSPSQLVGPVGIAQLSGSAAEISWVALFSLMSMISLNLGLLNLLPVPVLDGGHITIMALEGLSRRDFSTRAKERMLLVGLVLLLTLMVTVVYNDLTRIAWIERLMPWR